MKRWMKQSVALLMAAGMVLTLAACGVKAENLMDGVKPREVEEYSVTDDDRAAVSDFGLRLLTRTGEEVSNSLISPLSVMTALGMTMNGAEGKTLEEMESVLGMDRERLNGVLRTWIQGAEGKRFHSANSVWVTDHDSFTVNRDFLETVASHYTAEFYQTPMDESTVKDVNLWVNKQTRGMIPEILERLSPDTVMCLVNALAFEDKWQVPYEKHQIDRNIFYKADSTPLETDFLYSDESRWLEGEGFTGVMKPYRDSRYAFAALLPAEGTTPEQLAAALDGEKLHKALMDCTSEQVTTAIPRFKAEYSVELSETMTDMGMPLAFGPDADFSGLGKSDKGGICIGGLRHKTFLELDEHGTKAAAATAAMPDAAGLPPEECREVILDRPFLYMLVDTQQNVPFFLGIMNDPTLQ